MRIVYMGTPRFAVAPLLALAEAGYEIAGVVTRTDKPAGRGRAVVPPEVKIAAVGRGLAVFQPRRVRDPEFIEKLRAINPDAVVVAAYGQILPKEILALPRLGCINIHASLLPLLRGAAPVNWAVIMGEKKTGVTIMQMDEGMDTGAILMQEEISIEPKDTAGSLAEKLSALGAKLIVKALPMIEAGKLAPVRQDESKATLAPLLKKEDGLVDWNMTAEEIHNRVRGLSPWPGAYGFLEGKTVKIIETVAAQGAGEPGMIYLRNKDAMEVGAGKDMLRVLRIQPEGKRPMTAEEFLRGHRGVEGKKLTGPISH